MKKVYYYLLLIMIALGSCKDTDQLKQSEVLTTKKEQAVIKEIKSIMNTTIKGFNTLNVDSVFKDMNSMGFSRFINNGIILDNYDSTYMTVKKIYSKLKTLNVVVSDESYTVLSLNSVLFSASFKEDLIDNNNRMTSNQGAMTFVFKRIDNNWKMIHVHQSFFPINQNN